MESQCSSRLQKRKVEYFSEFLPGNAVAGQHEALDSLIHLVSCFGHIPWKGIFLEKQIFFSKTKKNLKHSNKLFLVTSRRLLLFLVHILYKVTLWSFFFQNLCPAGGSCYFPD
jgi:hypothetical protein